MNIPLSYEHLFYKYFIRRSVGQATKSRNVKKNVMKGFVFFVLIFDIIFQYIISKSFATYGCCHPCYGLYSRNGKILIYLITYLLGQNFPYIRGWNIISTFLRSFFLSFFFTLTTPYLSFFLLAIFLYLLSFLFYWEIVHKSSIN